MWELGNLVSKETHSPNFMNVYNLFSLQSSSASSLTTSDMCRALPNFSEFKVPITLDPLICERDNSRKHLRGESNRYTIPKLTLLTWWLCVPRNISSAPSRPCRGSCFRKCRWTGLKLLPDRSCQPILLFWLTCLEKIKEKDVRDSY